LEKFDVNKHWNGFINHNLAVNCPTEELSREFINYCKNNKISWFGTDDGCWTYRKENTCYWAENGEISWEGINYANEMGCNVVQFTGFNIETLETTSKIIKPPLGLTPKKVHTLLRCQDICRALNDYINYEKCDYDLMREWTDELHDKLFELQKIN
jgi:hypothetical protein